MKRYDQATIDNIPNALAVLDQQPPEDLTFSVSDIVKMHEPKIREYLDRGYSISQIVSALNGAKIKVAESTLKKELQSIRKKSPSRAKRLQAQTTPKKPEVQNTQAPDPEPSCTPTPFTSRAHTEKAENNLDLPDYDHHRS